MNISGRPMMCNMLFVWIVLTYLDRNGGNASVGIRLCIDTCVSTPRFDATKEVDTFVCRFSRNREQKRRLYIENKKNGGRSQVIGIECLITTQQVEPWCVAAQCMVVSNKVKRLSGNRSPGQYNSVVSNTRYSCTRRSPPNLSWCVKRKEAESHEKDKTRKTSKNINMKNNDSSRKKIPENHTSTNINDYEAIEAGRDRILVKQYRINKTWDQASQQCEADGGHLIKLDTEHKLRAIRSLNIHGSHWIGMKDLFDNDTFFWIDGAPLRVSHWCVQQPSHLSQEDQEENCVEFCQCIIGLQALNDRTCTDLLPFLCQR